MNFLESCAKESSANCVAERNESTTISVSLAWHRFATTVFGVDAATGRRLGTVGQRQIDTGQQGDGRTSERIQLCRLACVSRRVLATIKLLSHTDTTRAPRPTERDGIDYHFVTEAQMQHMISNDDFVEYAIFSGNYYGTRCDVKFRFSILSKVLFFSKRAVELVQESGRRPVLDVDIQGVLSIKQKLANAHYIFITTSFDTLVNCFVCSDRIGKSAGGTTAQARHRQRRGDCATFEQRQT